MTFVAFAGLHAEGLVNLAAEEWRSYADWQSALDLSVECGVLPRTPCCIGDDVHHRHLERLNAESRRLVRRLTHPIRRLADELLQRRTMLGDEVEALLEPLSAPKR